MRITTVDRDNATVELSRTEVMILNSALNEVCNGIEVPEFETRMGADIMEVRQLLTEMKALLEKRALNQPRLL